MGFYDQPILNSPYAKPDCFHPLDEHGQPLDLPSVPGRRPSKFVVAVPKSRRRSGGAQATLDLETYDDNSLINEIRGHVDAWRDLPGTTEWGVTPTTQSLLEHWRHHDFANQRPFFCQIEAVETLIWLTEVARSRKQYAHLWRDIEARNADANPELLRLALKMATGAGKTTVMAMIIAWQTLNAVRTPGSDRYSRAFLIVTPGITIKDRLQVLQPEHPENYYDTREIVPKGLLGDLRRATVVITNYHAFQHRETLAISKTGRAFLQGNDPEPITTKETDGAMLDRACGKLLSFKNVLVLNDEAHHCYRERQLTEDEQRERDNEAKENNEAARLWISGIEALKRKVGVRAVYDLSATPFFLRGSGYQEGTLFPWVVSDFSLMDAIECGIVKLPRVPVADNLALADEPVYRDLWKHIGKAVLRTKHPLDLPPMLMTALHALYSNYEEYHAAWAAEAIDVPPVFIVVCQNTAISRLVYDWIAGFERDPDDGDTIAEDRNFHPGALPLFRNYDDYGQPIARPNTLLIDSRQIESGEALDKAFKDIAEAEIAAFKEARKHEAGAAAGEPTDGEILREVMNTVGRKGRLGEQVRCVVSVSMLTEGWDANTVTHILGVRAFGTQLLCEQVVGRGLRRLSYDLNEADKFDVEYAQVMGIPFAFTGKAVSAPPTKPKNATHVRALRERAALEITFPRVEGFRVDLPGDTLTATFTEDSRWRLTPVEVGPCEVRMEGIVGEGITLTPEVLSRYRPSEISFHLAKHLLYTRFRDEDGFPRQHLFMQIQKICRRWLEEGYLQLSGGVQLGAVLYAQIADTACELIANAIIRGVGERNETPPARAVLDPYDPTGSTASVNFQTTKAVWTTDRRRSHVSHVTLDSEWEAELARVLEGHPRVLSYAKNQGMNFDIPYRLGRVAKRYVPDFLVHIDTGEDEPLTAVLETKGYRGIDAQVKADTMHTLWVPGVNALGSHGRWAFGEFREVFDIQAEFATFIDTLSQKVPA